MRKETEEAISILVEELSNGGTDHVQMVLAKCVYYGGVDAEQAIRVLADISQV